MVRLNGEMIYSHWQAAKLALNKETTHFSEQSVLLLLEEQASLMLTSQNAATEYILWLPLIILTVDVMYSSGISG